MFIIHFESLFFPCFYCLLLPHSCYLRLTGRRAVKWKLQTFLVCLNEKNINYTRLGNCSITGLCLYLEAVQSKLQVFKAKDKINLAGVEAEGIPAGLCDKYVLFLPQRPVHFHSSRKNMVCLMLYIPLYTFFSLYRQWIHDNNRRAIHLLT